MLINSDSVTAFQVHRGGMTPLHHQWFLGTQRPTDYYDFKYGKGVGPKSITVTGLTNNAGSHKENPSYNSDSYDYNDVMRELDRQITKRTINI